MTKHHKLLHLIRITSFCEGVSFLILVLIAMPLKHLAGIPEAVRYFGWAHGLLFLLLYCLLFIALNLGALTFRMTAITAIAALLPAGPFFLDRKYRELERE